MNDDHSLGPATEALFARTFADKALLSAKDAAPLIGVHEKTLREMAEAGVIRFVIVGASTRRFTEADLRAFLAGERFGEIKDRVAVNVRPMRRRPEPKSIGITEMLRRHQETRKRKP